MKWILVELSVLPAQRDDLVSLFWELGTVGLEELERQPRGVPVRAFFPSDRNPDSLRLLLWESLAARGLPATDLKVECVEEDPDRWVRICRDAFRGFSVSSSFYIHPGWEAPSPLFPVNVLIEPGRAFGTGTHESTRLCLLALERLAPRAQSLADVGTGSGILSLAARKLNPHLRIVAFDRDAEAVEAARENFLRNGLAGILVFVGEPPAVKGRFDVVAANLTLEIFRRILDSILPLVKQHLVVSGFTESQAVSAEHLFSSGTGLRLRRNWSEGGWLCFHLERR